MPRIEIVPLRTDHKVRPGDDLAGYILAAAVMARVELRAGDVICVASKVVSKSEGATVELPAAPDVHAARRELAEREAVRVVADTPWVLVVETRHGFVCANAGIDTSNVEDGRALLLPADPDASAAHIARRLSEHVGGPIGVVVTDTFGRPWRMGQTDVALGAAGVEALRDERGSTDMEGHTLEVTLVAVADELAAAADLARRKADGTPFVLIRGADVPGDGRAADLLRDAAEDVFRYGGATAVARAMEDRAPVRRFTDAPVDRDVLAGAARLAATSLGSEGRPVWRMLRVAAERREAFASAARTMEGADTLASAPEVLVVVDGSAVAVGAAVQTFQVAVRAHGLASAWIELDPGAARGALTDEVTTVWGALVVGRPAAAPEPVAQPDEAPLFDTLPPRRRLFGLGG